ncbi:dimethylargininase [Mobilicoccus massiliensis]|uniref:dimethylargininase n=1 Tax=Mobilicoccus massiliensis TaxID=1522310 RepID=UPI000590FE8C|nr:dimethylargininase [Mobilicoccus massiliensis]
MNRRHALVRRPSTRLAEGLVTHIDRSPVDPDLAQRQWEAYVAALQNAGWETIEVPPAEDHPDSVFIEDPVFVYGDLAVLTRSGAPERRGETDGLREVLERHGYRVEEMTEPATLDGGDILKFDGTVWVGQGGRTNEEGLAQLTRLLEPFDVEVVGVPLESVLHLKTAVTALPDGTVIGYPPLVDAPLTWGDDFMAVPEEAGAHVVLLGDDTVLMSTSAPETAELLRERGLEVVTVDISEFEKLEGCVTCLSVRLRG